MCTHESGRRGTTQKKIFEHAKTAQQNKCECFFSFSHRRLVHWTWRIYQLTLAAPQNHLKRLNQFRRITLLISHRTDQFVMKMLKSDDFFLFFPLSYSLFFVIQTRTLIQSNLHSIGFNPHKNKGEKKTTSKHTPRASIICVDVGDKHFAKISGESKRM